MIWHYTSMSVLQELMKPESKLYATHTSFVNDTQECRLAAQASATYVTLLCNLWRGALEIPSEEKAVKDINDGELAPRFITCFSRVKGSSMYCVKGESEKTLHGSESGY